MNSVEISHLRKDFGRFTAVSDLSFTVKQGEVLGFLGPNGAGKSTTMKMITGFLTPTSGTAKICGFDILSQPIDSKRKIGYLPEGAPAYPDMNPDDFLNFIAKIRGLRGDAKTKRVREVIEKVNLGNVAHQSIDTLSKGYKRRVGLAQAILHDPDVLILDEPTDGLDPNQKHEVRSLIKNMAKEKVIILSTHILEEVDAVCTRAIIIANGKIVADGTPNELEAKFPTKRLDDVFRNLTK
jgi:ABC-2 type transport system ATP-binding protein